jgi:hypothetical protein
MGCTTETRKSSSVNLEYGKARPDSIARDIDVLISQDDTWGEKCDRLPESWKDNNDTLVLQQYENV